MIEFSQLMDAYMECRRHKRNSLAALAFEVDLEHNLVKLYDDIVSGAYRISPSVAFVVEKPVQREVFAADFRDRIVHHLLMQMLTPHLEQKFIFDSYACRKGRGTLFGIKRIKRFIAQCSAGYTKDCYILKCDISGFFMNIDRQKLWQMLEAFINKIDFGDRKSVVSSPQVQYDLFTLIDEPQTTSALSDLVLRLTRQIVMHNPIEGCRINGSRERWDGLPDNKSLYGVNNRAMPNGYIGVNYNKECRAKGLPIGNLTSQWFGNFYMNSFDHYMKHTLGIRYYGRYVDDFVIVHSDKEFLKELIPKIESFLSGELNLTLHPRKRYLQHYSKGVSFLGVVIKQGALLTGVRTKTGAYRAIERWSRLSNIRLLTPDEMLKFRDSVNSYWGLMKHHDSYKLRKKMSIRFSTQICNRTVCKDNYCKIAMRDYTLLPGGIVIPYVEWYKLFDD